MLSLHYGERGDAWNWLDAQPAMTISYAGSQMTLPLHGSRLQHRVVYTPLSDADVASVSVGDSVLISGVAYAARDAAHHRLEASAGARKATYSRM